MAAIELAADLPVDSLDGLEDFSHAEIIFVMDRVLPEKVVSGAGSRVIIASGQRLESLLSGQRGDRIGWGVRSCGSRAERIPFYGWSGWMRSTGRRSSISSR